MREYRLICALFLSLLAGKLACQNPDLQFLKSTNIREMPAWDNGMRGVSNSVYVTMPASAVGIWANGYFTRDKEMMRNGYKSAVTIGFALLTSTGLKYLVNRTRPYKEYPNDIVLRVKEPGPFSFPSGHTASAFATATALSLSYHKWYVTAPSFLYAGFVGYSRMRLGVHYPSDVLAGALIGIGSGFLTWFVDKRIQGRK